MTARLYVDHHVNVELVARLRAGGHDVLTTAEAKMETADDNAQLEFAASEQRIFYTQNIRDFLPLAQLWSREGRQHCGLMYSSLQPPARLYEWITAALVLYPGGVTDLTVSLPVAG